MFTKLKKNIYIYVYNKIPDEVELKHVIILNNNTSHSSQNASHLIRERKGEHGWVKPIKRFLVMELFVFFGDKASPRLTINIA